MNNHPPTLPRHTCPLIDRLKTRILAAHELARINAKHDESGVFREIAHELFGEEDNLEELRSANLALRSCAEYWQAEAEELQNQLSLCESQLENVLSNVINNQ